MIIIYFIYIIKLSLSQAMRFWVFFFSDFPLHSTGRKGEEGASSCVVHSCQLRLNHDNKEGIKMMTNLQHHYLWGKTESTKNFQPKTRLKKPKGCEISLQAQPAKRCITAVFGFLWL